MNHFSKIIIAVLILGGTFLLGVSLSTPRYADLMTVVKKNISDTLEYPSTAQFRDVTSFFYRQTSDGGDLYYVCGEVYLYNNELQPIGFKRFITKVYEKAQEKVDVSIPIIDGYGDVFSEEQFNKIWSYQCK